MEQPILAKRTAMSALAEVMSVAIGIRTFLEVNA